MTKMKIIKDINVRNKRVLVRCDFNVPLDDQGNVVDDFRIKQTLPTLKYLQGENAKIILISHRSDKRSLDSAWKRLGEYIDTREIKFLDNLRLNKGEEMNDDKFAKELAGLADVYVNEAFGVCHREHASIVGVPKYLPSVAGFLLQKEVKILSKVLEDPERPFVAIIGGAKLESKAKVIDKFLEIADQVLIGGKIGFALKIKSEKLFIPTDYVDDFDIGPETIETFTNIIKKAKSVVWAGPMGKFEESKYQKGSKVIAEEIIKSGAFSVVGGGDTIAVLNKLNLKDKFNHVSTGGGAMLAFLAGDELPGLKALNYGD
ncbi:phosphoglycerate kinase [Patescibacteria group bacterium]|nr:phosphoglycerate kinase [Patescibacteria group bacterium]